MVQNKTVDLLEDSEVKLAITVAGDDTQKEYDILVGHYCKTAQVKGFRKGKVPADVLKRKFGPALLSETAQKIIEQSLEEAIESIDQKPLAQAVPEIKADDDLVPGKDFTFEVLYDTYPQVEIGDYAKSEIEAPKVEVTDDDIQRELKTLQEQNALVVDKKEAVVATDDIVNIDYVEVDEDGNDKSDTKREGFVFQVGTRYNVYELDDDIIGMQKGDTKTIEKEYPTYFERKELAGRSVKLSVTVNEVKEKQMPDIDDELAQDISDDYETLEDLKKDIQSRLEGAAQTRIRQNKIDRLLDKIIEVSQIPLPKSIVNSQLEAEWQNLLKRNNTDENRVIESLSQEGKTKEDVLNDWRTAVERSQKAALVTEKLLETEGIDITPEEFEDKLTAMASDTPIEEVRERIKQNKLEDAYKHEFKKEKLYDALLEKVVVKEGKTITFLELIQGNH